MCKCARACSCRCYKMVYFALRSGGGSENRSRKEQLILFEIYNEIFDMIFVGRNATTSRQTGSS